MSLSTAMRAALKDGAPVWLLTLALPGGTQRWADGAGYNSAGNGAYAGRVEQWGDLTGRAGDAGCGLESNELTVEILDNDQVLAREFARYGETVYGSVATVQFAEPSVVPADWSTEYVGVLHTARQRISNGSLRWSLTLKPRDFAVTGKVPRLTIGPPDWSSAPTSLVGKPVPIIYGTHDSRGLTETGAVPLLELSPTRRLVGLAWCEVPRVYVGGALTLAGWTVARPLRGGHLYTVVDFDTDPGDAVTADVVGLDTGNDGTGDPIEDFDFLKHLLVNFVFRSHPGYGAWYDDGTAPVDTTSFATTKAFLAGRGYAFSRRFADAVDADAIVQEACATAQVYPYWTPAGRLGVLPIDPTEGAQTHPLFGPGVGPRVRTSDLRWDRDQVGEAYELDYRATPRMDRIATRFCFLDTTPAQSLEVRDPSVADEASTSLDLRACAAWVVE